MHPRLRSALALATVMVAAGVAAPATAKDWYARGHGRPPTADKVFVCHGYSCRIVTPVRLGPADLARIAGKLKAGLPDAEAERQALSKAVQVFETIVGERIGTSADLPGMQFGQGKDDQEDCVDEATNTTSLLLLLKEHGYLRHHTVEQPVSRGWFIDGRYPHNTAVLVAQPSGEAWAVDSWPRANGEPPVIIPLAQWKRMRTGLPES